ncbi:MAG: helix-turn-helix domain-containing protein [Bacteroidetes bacterium]|nr:helix-turn-helix domain-containing protein [Bacteroidota bacterium]
MSFDVVELIEKYRVEKRYSQVEMADLLGVSQSTYCRWRSGKSLIKYKHYPAIAQLLGLSAKDILPPAFN